jgi:hypothetical protein
MINLGCRNQFSVGITFQVYMDLCEGAWYSGTMYAMQVLLGKIWEQTLNLGSSFVIICMPETKPCTFAISDRYSDIRDDCEG